MVNERQLEGFDAHGRNLESWARQPEGEEPPPSLLKEYYRTLTRQKRWILGMALGCGFLAVLLHLTTQPIYRTRTSLNIQSVNSDFLNLHSVEANAATPMDTLVQTQVKLLQSDSLLDRVRVHLAGEPHPASIPKTDLLSRVERALHVGGKQQIPYADLVDETLNGVKVKPIGITQLVEITCDSWDAKFSAAFCNTLTEQFREVDLEGRGDQARLTSDWLTQQAADVRQKAESSEQKLIAATGGNGLILSEQAGGVGEDGLRAIQTELVNAEATRMQAEAQLVTRHKLTNQGPIPNESPTYAADKLKLADLQTQIAALVPPLTEANPRIIHLRSEIQQVQTNLAKETLESDQKLQNEFDAAKHREDLLTIAYRSQQGQVSSDLQKSAGVSLLRREVESEQQLYQTLLQRAKEAGFAAAIPTSTIRVVDPAMTPHMPALPRRDSEAVMGLVLGCILGTIIAFFKDRSSVLLRMPGDSERLLNTGELGVIPSPQVASPAAVLRRRLLPGNRSQPMLGGGDGDILDSAVWNDDFSLVAEAYRNATISILNTEHKRPGRTYVIASPSSGEGKTTITCNIGVALSKARRRVVLIDGDLRKPSLHKAFGIPNKMGLRQVLSGVPVDMSDICHATQFENLSVIPAGQGRETTVELLHSGEFGTLMSELGRQFDVILVDTPPLLHMADARLLAAETQGTILVFRSGVTSREDAMTARNLLARDRIRVVGSILNDFNPRSAGRYGYYNSYSAYRRHADEEHAGARL